MISQLGCFMRCSMAAAAHHKVHRHVPGLPLLTMQAIHVQRACNQVAVAHDIEHRLVSPATMLRDHLALCCWPLAPCCAAAAVGVLLAGHTRIHLVIEGPGAHAGSRTLVSKRGRVPSARARNLSVKLPAVPLRCSRAGLVCAAQQSCSAMR